MRRGYEYEPFKSIVRNKGKTQRNGDGKCKRFNICGGKKKLEIVIIRRNDRNGRRRLLKSNIRSRETDLAE